MSRPRRITLLKEVPVFGGLSEATITFILERASTYCIEQGEYLFKENEQTTSMYVMESGSVAIVKTHNGHPYLLRHMLMGDCIGEMALFDFLPRSSSAFVVERAQLIEISSAVLMDVYHFDLEQFALIQMNMGREVTRRLRVADERYFGQRLHDSFDRNISQYKSLAMSADFGRDY